MAPLRGFGTVTTLEQNPCRAAGTAGTGRTPVAVFRRAIAWSILVKLRLMSAFPPLSIRRQFDRDHGFAEPGGQDLRVGAYLWATSFGLLWLSVALPYRRTIEPKTLKHGTLCA